MDLLIFLFMGQGSSTPSCCNGIHKILIGCVASQNKIALPGVNPSGARLAVPEPVLSSNTSFKFRRPRRTKNFDISNSAWISRTCFLEYDSQLRLDNDEKWSEPVHIAEKIAKVLFAHIDGRVFSSPEDDPYHYAHFHQSCFLCIKQHSSIEVQMEDIHARLQYVMDAISVCPEILVISLIYVERLLQTSKARFTPANWDVIITAAVVVASKVWEDVHPWNIDFDFALSKLRADKRTARGAFSSKSIYAMESLFLKHIDWNVEVNADLYAHYHFNLAESADSTEMLQPIHEENEAAEDDTIASPRSSSCIQRLDLTTPKSSSSGTPAMERKFRISCNGIERRSCSNSSFGRLDPRNPYVGTFQHATPAKRPSGSWLSGGLCCLCNMQGTCLICIRRTRLAHSKENYMNKCMSTVSLATTTSPSPASSSICSGDTMEENYTAQNGLTITGATGRFLAQELKKSFNACRDENTMMEASENILKPGRPYNVHNLLVVQESD